MLTARWLTVSGEGSAGGRGGGRVGRQTAQYGQNDSQRLVKTFPQLRFGPVISQVNNRRFITNFKLLDYFLFNL